MDPLSSLSLAGTTIQFVQFIGSLLSNTRRIYNSATGLSSESELLETIYGKLSTFSSELSATSETAPETQPAATSEEPPQARRSSNDASIAELARICKEDCDNLIGILEKVKNKNSPALAPKWWKSFQSALLEVTKWDEIKDIKARIEKTQTQMVFYLCLASSEKLEGIVGQLAALKANTLVQQRTFQYDEILRTVQQVQRKVDTIRLESDINGPLSSNDVETLTSKVSELSLKSQKCAWEDGILRSLNYEQRPARHDSIPKAYRATFEWVFKAGASQGRLLDWFAKGDDVFWVSGKPGSGKSTLIKFLAGNRRTIAALKRWGGEKRVAIASHYFWGAGTSIQRSQEGLLRSLLYDILSQASELIPQVCPSRWADVARSGRVSSTWTLHDLSRALLAAAKQPQLPIRFCIFIDGLDEYKGDHAKLCQLLLELGKCAAVKLCVSSRPWNDFLQNFAHLPKLHVHDLTQEDIRYYSEDELCKHPRWRIVENHCRNGKSLVDEITSRAHGVFLWVFLVIRQLRDGLTNYDSGNDLWKRIDAIPSDLEQFFKQILGSVEPFYHDKMAETLLIAAAGKEPLHGAIYSFHDMSFDDKYYAIREPVVPWNLKEFLEFMEPFSRRLSSRTKGLLEINTLERVEFLHRTVRDFLRTSDMMTFLAHKARPRFDPNLAIFQGYICWIKHANFLSAAEGLFFRSSGSHLTSALEEALSYASDSDDYKNPFDSLVHDLIDELEFSVQKMFKSGQASFAGTDTVQRTQNVFSKCVLRSGLGDYPMKKMAKMPGYLDDLEVPPLSLILRVDDKRKATDSVEWSARRINLLRALLEKKHDPNQIYRSPFSGIQTTAWCEYVRQLVPYPALEGDVLPIDYPSGPFLEAVSKGVFSTLLEFGADPNGLVEDDASCPEPLPVWAKFFLSCFSSPELSRHDDIYLRNLEAMMSRADLEAVTGYMQPLGWWIVGERSASVISRGIGVPVTFRTATWDILRCFLRQVVKRSLDFPTLQFYANVIRIFLRTAVQPTLPVAQIRPILHGALPLGLSTYILDGIDMVSDAAVGGVRAADVSSGGLKRSLAGEGESDLTTTRKRIMRISEIIDPAGD
ncbi:hypothetical protein B0H66DRAFT_14431 [Apodospora peruviana]|uniref:NACHT domain-containing protein n=1 Tax=Apodospora peruviana TaxID=516989 RepID=A0AAE0MED5_9PEZI|nr:hypothetical protein B0H66DRAFT_14431 [Apodospora peruviana]